MTVDNAAQSHDGDVARGTIFSLLAIPAGVVAWVILWNLGFIASLVAFGVAYLAMFLYRFGSGGALALQGAIRVTAVTVVTLLLSFIGGMVSDALGLWVQTTGASGVTSLLSPDFWAAFQTFLGIEGVAASYLPDFGLALLFGALGCFSVLRGAFQSAKAAPPATDSVAPPAAPPVAPPAAPPAGEPGLDEPREPNLKS